MNDSSMNKCQFQAKFRKGSVTPASKACVSVLQHFFLFVLILMFLCVWEFQKVIKSVKDIKTFGKNNVQSFRRIGRLLIGYAILTSYTSFRFEDGGFKGVSIPFTVMFLILFAFIMAEIFKEGVMLKEENELTI